MEESPSDDVGVVKLIPPAPPGSIGRQCDTREDCRVGDWIAESAVPEWKGGEGFELYRHPGVVVPAVENSLGGMKPDKPLEFRSFRPETRHGRRIWVRNN